jgi:hypothetical protein
MIYLMVQDPSRVPNVKAVGQNGFTLDMFGRLKVGEGYTLFDSQNRYKDSGDFSNEIFGTASSTFLTNESTVSLAVGTTSGDKITRESRRIFPYQPGKSLQILQTFVFSPPKTNLRQRAGYFSRQNGIFLEQDGNNVYIVKRSYVTGEMTQIRVAQEDWNNDRLDGTGKTDIVLDLTKAQILFIEIEWLGAGSMRVGFVINGVPVVAHRFDHANIINSVYMTTAALPIRYEIENTGATASASSMKQICASIISNGGYQRRTEDWTAARTATASVGSNFFPLVSIRLAPGRTDAVIVPSAISVLPIAQGNYQYALIRNATITGGDWVLHSPSTGNVEYNINATSMTGGTIVYEGLTTSSNQGSNAINLSDNLQRFDLQLGRTNADTPVSDIITVALRSLGGNQSGIGSISWNDLV